MKKFRFCIGLFLVLLTGCNRAPSGAQTSTPPLTDESLQQAIKLGADYMTRAVKSDGEFVYLDHLDPQITYAVGYNELRHAGTLYPMGEYFAHYERDPQLKAAMVRAAKYFVKKYVAPIPDVKGKAIPGVLGSWTVPADEGQTGNREVKLGGLGLGLVGLLQAERSAPGTTPLSTLRGLGNGIVFLQEADGRFYSKYDPKRGGKLDQWDSLYYPGEAALGLVMLYEHDPDPKQKTKWLNTAMRALGFLARARLSVTELPADHWALIATGKVLPHYAASDGTVPRHLIMEHALKLTRWILNDPDLKSNRTTPVATRLEGLLAMLEVLPPEEGELRNQIIENARTQLARLVQCQVTSGELSGGIPRHFKAHAPEAGKSAVGEDGKINRDGEIRIDYVQHAVSAMMSYDLLVLQSQSGAKSDDENLSPSRKRPG